MKTQTNNHILLKTRWTFSYICLPPVVCRRAHVLFTFFVFLCIFLPNTYCVVFCLFLSSSCVPYVASLSGLSLFGCPFVLAVSLDCPCLIAPSVFSNVYLLQESVLYTYCVVFLFLCCQFSLDCPLFDCPFLIAPSCCQSLWIVLVWLPLRYSLTFIVTS